MERHTWTGGREAGILAVGFEQQDRERMAYLEERIRAEDAWKRKTPAKNPCLIDGCLTREYCRGLCYFHYERERKKKRLLPRYVRSPLPSEQVERIIRRMREQGATAREIGEAVGLTPDAVAVRVRRMGLSSLPYRLKQAARMLNSGMTPETVAQRLRIPVARLRRLG